MRNQEIHLAICVVKIPPLFHFLHLKRSLETKLVICNIMNVEEGYLLPTIARKITCRRFD